MRTAKGISCKVNSYTVTAIAIVDGEAKSFSFETDTRDARAAKKFIAEQAGVPASQVIVSFKLVKHTFTIDTDYENLVKVLNSNDIYIIVDNEESTDADTAEA